MRHLTVCQRHSRPIYNWQRQSKTALLGKLFFTTGDIVLQQLVRDTGNDDVMQSVCAKRRKRCIENRKRRVWLKMCHHDMKWLEERGSISFPKHAQFTSCLMRWPNSSRLMTMRMTMCSGGGADQLPDFGHHSLKYELNFRWTYMPKDRNSFE